MNLDLKLMLEIVSNTYARIVMGVVKEELPSPARILGEKPRSGPRADLWCDLVDLYDSNPSDWELELKLLAEHHGVALENTAWDMIHNTRRVEAQLKKWAVETEEARMAAIKEVEDLVAQIGPSLQRVADLAAKWGIAASFEGGLAYQHPNYPKDFLSTHEVPFPNEMFCHDHEFYEGLKEEGVEFDCDRYTGWTHDV